MGWTWIAIQGSNGFGLAKLFSSTVSDLGLELSRNKSKDPGILEDISYT
jgi:hypothetical protein